MKNEALEAVVASAASKSTYAGAGSMVLGWFLSNEFAVLVGVIVGVAGLAVNFYYKHKADRRAERIYQARLDRITKGYRTDTDLAELGEDE